MLFRSGLGVHLKSRHVCAAALLIVLASGPGYAQVLPETPAPPQDSQQTPTSSQPGQAAPAAPPAKLEKRGEIAAAPIPVIDPTIGNGIALTAVYTVHLQKDDKVSPPSDFAAGGFRTTDGAWGLAAGARLFLMRDRFRILFGSGTGTVHYKFYGVGNDIGAGTGIPISILRWANGRCWPTG